MLHVLSGDEALRLVEAAGLPGRRVVWREMWSEGLAPGAPPSDVLWARRDARLPHEFGIDARALAAHRDAARGLIRESAKEDDIVLWFDDDLFSRSPPSRKGRAMRTPSTRASRRMASARPTPSPTRCPLRSSRSSAALRLGGVHLVGRGPTWRWDGARLHHA